MPYTIFPSEDNQYIIINITGELNWEVALNYTVESHKLGKQLATDKFLVDLTSVQNTESVLDNYSNIREGMHHPDINLHACVALLASPDDHSHDFVETVSRNTGYDLTIFRDKDKAIQHLVAVKEIL